MRTEMLETIDRPIEINVRQVEWSSLDVNWKYTEIERFSHPRANYITE